MKVSLVSYTQLNRLWPRCAPDPINVSMFSGRPDVEQVAEFAGRVCYNSTDKMGEKEGWLSERIAQGHESIIEHVSFTFLVEGISRSCSHQLVRHRLASYSQESLRYVDASKMEMVMPQSIREVAELDDEEWFGTCVDAMDEYKYMVKHCGIPKEDARFILPMAICTRIVVTMNARTLRHFFKVRASKAAQWEIRGVAKEMLRIVLDMAPGIFGDLRHLLEGE